MNIDILYKNIGAIDEKLDCLFPAYLVYPDVPKYELIHEKNYILTSLEKHFKKIDEIDLLAGDLILFQFFDMFHFGVYAEDKKFFHCCKKHKLRLGNLERYRRYIKGFYQKWHLQYPL